MGSELSQLLEREARAEKDKALGEARARAEEILAAGRREAEEALAAGRHRLEGERAQEHARATSTASLRAAALVLAAKDEGIRAVFERAEAEVRAAAADPARRRAMIRALLREAARGVSGGRVAVEVSPGDADAAREVVRELGLDAEVREAPGVRDGVRLVSQDGRAIIENMLPGRLARARRELVSRVAEVLWGA
ncbi:MAG TPA: V-type ATP synthase subunit E [bacterium]|nr:V-type ATP synthase subunit E [bacterium]